MRAGLRRARQRGVATVSGGLVRYLYARDDVGKNILVVPGDGPVDDVTRPRAVCAIGSQRRARREREEEEER
jgi:hypothetical protein